MWADLLQMAFDSLLVEKSKELFQTEVHIMIENDPEEITNGLHMQQVFKEAGISA